MTTIQLGRMGNSVPGGAPQINTPASGMGVARALTEAGRTVAGIAADTMMEQRKRDEQEQAQADRLKAYQASNEGQLDLRRLADDLGQRIVSGAITQKDADEEWARASRDVMTERTRELAPHVRDQVGGMLRIQTQELADGVLTRARRDRTRAEIKTGLLQSMELAERNALEDRPRAIAHVETMLTEMGASAGLGPDDQFRTLQNFRERTALNFGQKLLRLAGDNSAHLDDLMKRVQSDEFADLTPEKRGVLETQISNRQAKLEHAREVARVRAEAAAQRRSRDAEDATKALQTLIDGGSLPADEFLAEVQAKTMGTPYAEAVKSLVKQGADRAGFASLPPDRQQAALMQLRAQASATGSTPELERRISTLQTIANRSAEKVEREPLQWGADTRLLGEVQPLQFRTIGDLLPQLAARREQAGTVSAALKRPVSPLLGAEADRVGEMLNLLPAGDRARMVSMLAQAVGPESSGAIARQIDKKDRALGLAFAMASSATPEGRLTSELVLKGAQAKSDGTSTKGEKEPSIEPARWRATAAAALADVYPAQTMADAQVDAAELVIHALAAENQGRLTPKDIRRAVDLVVGGKLVEFNGRKVPLPAGIDEDMLEKRLKSVSADEIGAPEVIAAGVRVPTAEWVKSLPGAELVYAGPGRYSVLVKGRPVTRPDGRRVVIGVTQ